MLNLIRGKQALDIKSCQQAFKNMNSFNKGFNSLKIFSFSSKIKTDYFETNFKLSTTPDRLPSFNDLDSSFALDIFNKIDIDNISTIPLLSGRLSRLWCLTEDTIHHFVMFMAHDLNMGMGLATVSLAVFIRLLFSPITLRSFKVSQQMRLIYPEQKEHNEKITKLRKAGEMQLVRIENEKFSKYKESLGIRNNPLNFVLGLSQAAVLACWASLVMRFAYNVEDYPEMLTGGFFWFRDLSNIDPFFILPIINSTMLMLNIYTNNNTYSNVMMLKFRRYMFVMPFFSLPVMCTLETGIVLYFSVTSAITFLFQYVFLSQKMRTRLEVNNFYPGTKLEKLNKLRLTGDKYEENTEFNKYISNEPEEAETKQEEIQKKPSEKLEKPVEKSQTPPQYKKRKNK